MVKRGKIVAQLELPCLQLTSELYVVSNANVSRRRSLTSSRYAARSIYNALTINWGLPVTTDIAALPGFGLSAIALKLRSITYMARITAV
jgi:hypothetical protein